MSNFRWSPYVLLKGKNDIKLFWEQHFNSESKILFIIGKGFDIRMNLGIKELSSVSSAPIIQCLLIEFDEGKNSPSDKYKKYVDENTTQLKGIVSSINTKKIKLLKSSDRKTRRVGDREAANIINSYTDIEKFTDIIVDISALPRSVFFSIIGKILSLLDNYSLNNGKISQNLYILTAENAKLDSNIIEEGIDEDINYTYGFTDDLELSTNNPIVWFPMLGEGKNLQLSKAHTRVNPNEICPVLPFPAKDPRRSDKLIIEYNRLIFDEFRVESQNIIYAHEQNPFEVYRSLTLAIENYKKSLSKLGGCRSAISVFSSKLLSIGALLTSFELEGVGILNVDSQGYRIINERIIEELNQDTELFLSWIYGEPYFVDKN